VQHGLLTTLHIKHLQDSIQPHRESISFLSADYTIRSGSGNAGSRVAVAGVDFGVVWGCQGGDCRDLGRKSPVSGSAEAGKSVGLVLGLQCVCL
jgi:hypothetical protein